MVMPMPISPFTTASPTRPGFIHFLERINEGLGRFLGLAALLLVIVQFILVLLGSVFSYGSIWLQESRLYLNALIFMGGAGYTLLHDGHVRVDLFYGSADTQAQSWVDLLGGFIFLLPFLFLIGWAGFPYVVSSILNLEGSTETGGIPFVYGLKALIAVFAISLGLQAVALIGRSMAIIFNSEDSA
jgi:TRAP-type mannitol/chloroaromatic compound transport system permease small subunit